MSIRLLLLDDDESIGNVILRIARVSGFDAYYTSRPRDFFRALESWQPTHIALDLAMPEMDGVQVIARLASMSVSAKLIVSSGAGSRVLDAAARSAAHQGLEIVGVLPKPFRPADLRALLEQGGAQTPKRVRRVARTLPEIGADDIRRGLEEGQFSLVYQPKIDCRTGRVSGLEVLSRWAHPQYGLIPPEYFIVEAEKSDLMERLTLQVVEKSLRWFSDNVSPYESDFSLSINMSGKNLSESHLIDILPEFCEKCNVARDWLILELTETAAMENPVQSLDLLTRLRLKGFQLSIDDFGTGFSSMLQLVKLPFSEIKVDKSFVSSALRSAESRAVIKVTLELARGLGLRCTAEGVEDEATYRYLRDLGCDHVQGYYFARPLPPDEAVHWIRGRAAVSSSG